MPKRLNIEFIKKQFEKERYYLLSKEYEGAHQKLNYICHSGHKHSINWTNWQQGYRCPYCAGQAKPTIDFIRKEFEKGGYKLTSKTYKNNRQKLTCVCSNGHKHNIAWRSWQQGARCSYCMGNRKLTIDFIESEFKKEGYILLTKKYKNAHQKLGYICPKNHKHYTVWHSWKRGQRCPTCFFIRNSAENHPNWKGGISCEPYCFEWSSKEFKDFIKERDGNMCLNPDCWGNIHRLSVHHIDYNKKNCEPQNLITLCASCNSRANKDREWHMNWYKAILNKRYYKRNY